MAHGYRPLISKIRCNNPNKIGTRVKNYNYLHYIATREGVDLTDVSNRMTIEEMLDENLDLNEAGEDRAFAESSDEGYLKYMAHRPKSHGLFGNINTDNFSDVSSQLNKANQEKKNIYRGVISLSSLDAEVLGYKNIDKWNLYLKNVMPDIASALRLSPNDITWVAAFHMEDSHPHVHYMLWDNGDKIRTPYIHVSQQQACREICQDAMFSDTDETVIRQITAAEREEYYGLQNASRKEITDYFKNIFSDRELAPGIVKEKLPGRMSLEEHEKLNELYRKILSSMPGTGRITYQYMPVECKAYIDQVTDIMLNRPDLSKEYTAYISAVENIQKSLGKDAVEIRDRKDSAKNEIYNRTGNIVLKAIFNMKDYILDEQDSNRYEEDINDFSIPEEQPEKFIAENEFFSSILADYEKECKFSAYLNLGKCEEEREKIQEAAHIYQSIIHTEDISDTSWIKYEGRYRLARIMLLNEEYDQALQLISEYDVPDKSGKMELLRAEIYEKEESPYHDMDKAISLYLKAAEKGNTYAMVKLGKCYFWGLGVKKDKDIAIYWFKEAEKEGNLSATSFLQKMERESFNNFTYALLRQLLNSLAQTKEKQMAKMNEHEFKTKSKQAQKEEYLHRN